MDIPLPAEPEGATLKRSPDQHNRCTVVVVEFDQYEDEGNQKEWIDCCDVVQCQDLQHRCVGTQTEWFVEKSEEIHVPNAVKSEQSSDNFYCILNTIYIVSEFIRSGDCQSQYGRWSYQLAVENEPTHVWRCGTESQCENTNKESCLWKEGNGQVLAPVALLCTVDTLRVVGVDRWGVVLLALSTELACSVEVTTHGVVD